MLWPGLGGMCVFPPKKKDFAQFSMASCEITAAKNSGFDQPTHWIRLRIWPTANRDQSENGDESEIIPWSHQLEGMGNFTMMKLGYT